MGYKKVLKGHREILDYMMSINDNMDEEFLEEYLIDYFGENCEATLKDVCIADINPDNEDFHVQDPETQMKYNNAMKGDFDPIMLSNEFKIIDGHHRYRASLYQKRNSILAYIVSEE